MTIVTCIGTINLNADIDEQLQRDVIAILESKMGDHFNGDPQGLFDYAVGQEVRYRERNTRVQELFSENKRLLANRYDCASGGGDVYWIGLTTEQIAEIAGESGYFEDYMSDVKVECEVTYSATIRKTVTKSYEIPLTATDDPEEYINTHMDSDFAREFIDDIDEYDVEDIEIESVEVY